MAAASPADGTGDRLGVLVTAVALAASLCVAAMLLSADVRAVAKLRGARAAATVSVPVGTLSGWNPVTESEWAPLPAYKLVLFGNGHAAQPVDIGFWSDVASRANHLSPGIEFVVLCTPGAECRLPEGGSANLTLLSAMDPTQMRALAMHARRGEAIIHSAAGGRTSLVAGSSSEALAAEIVATFQRLEGGGGA